MVELRCELCELLYFRTAIRPVGVVSSALAPLSGQGPAAALVALQSFPSCQSHQLIPSRGLVNLVTSVLMIKKCRPSTEVTVTLSAESFCITYCPLVHEGEERSVGWVLSVQLGLMFILPDTRQSHR